MLQRYIPACALLLITIGPLRSATESAGSSDIPPYLYTVAKSYAPLAWLQGEDRFRADAAIVLSNQNGRHLLLPDFAASADPAVSFDGLRVLFAGKLRAQDPWQIWEISVAQGKPQRITSNSDDCIRPWYLPDDRIVYARKSAGRFVIEVADLAGGKPLPLTYVPSNSLPTDVLRDGRILFESAYPLGTEGNPEIYTVYSDGSG
ncbi:MAG TPA: hypothetical protein VE377_13930, partial [Candidatus Dormibacteraeota bacterium]|nr:hypothetical protein [Candidatus Dormibacteraeota bacterium]